ncbi:MAG TPA: methyltransferase domain-containing protein [Streptosporangiaceae bacterium]|jgi:SAM-dependent methyltransferase
MSQQDADERARALAARAGAQGDPAGWFEPLYAAAARGQAQVPWDRGGPHPLLVDWAGARRQRVTGLAEAGLADAGQRALVIGSGLGYDAEYLAGLGYQVMAFDISASATRAARERSPGSPVRYLTADLLALPASWQGRFDFVLESLTIQALPAGLRHEAIASVTRLVAPGGTLLVIAFAADAQDEPQPGPPWPLTRADISLFAAGGLREVAVEDIRLEGSPRRWRAELRRE